MGQNLPSADLKVCSLPGLEVDASLWAGTPFHAASSLGLDLLTTESCVPTVSTQRATYRQA